MGRDGKQGWSLLSFLRGLRADESGQGTTEYILILSATAVGASLISRGLTNVLNSGILAMGAELEKNLKTGRAPVNGVWSN